MVMGDNSFLSGRGFKSWHHILDGHFFTLICCKNVLFFEKTKNKHKEAGVSPFNFLSTLTFRHLTSVSKIQDQMKI